MSESSNEEWVERRLGDAMSSLSVPPEDRWYPRRRDAGSFGPKRLVGALFVSVLVVGAVTVLGGTGESVLAQLRMGEPPVRQNSALAVPSNWNVFTRHGLVIAAPPDFIAFDDIKEADNVNGPHQALAFRAADGSHPFLVSTWRDTTVASLVEQRFVKGNLQPVVQRPSSVGPGAVEVIVDNLKWNDPARREGGTYQARHIVVQLTPTTVAQFGVTAEWIAGASTKVSADQARVEDLVAGSAFALVDSRIGDGTRAERAMRSVLPLNDEPAAAPADFTGSVTAYRTLADTTVYVVTYQTSSARLADDPNEGGASHNIAGPVSYYGTGNVIVAIRSGDAQVRLMLLRSLADLSR